MNTPERWGLFSPQAELRLQSVHGHPDLQFDSRARLAQSVARRRPGAHRRHRSQRRRHADDDSDGDRSSRRRSAFRPSWFRPRMQGGCTCENCSLLRVGTGNVEFAALAAPRALGMTGADDWTREIMTKGFPQLKQHYAMLGAGDKVMARALVQFPHNYNYVSREVMYQWFNKHLQMGLPEPVVEEDYRPLSIAEMSVWDADHPRPTGGEDYERELLAWMTEDADGANRGLDPSRQPVVGQVSRGGGRSDRCDRGACSCRQAGSIEVGAAGVARSRRLAAKSTALLRYPAEEEELPVVLLRPKHVEPADGHLAERAGQGGDLWRRRSADRRSPQVVGRRHGDRGPRPDLSGRVSGRRQAARRGAPGEEPARVCSAFTLGYNRALVAQRAHDVLSIVSWLRDERTAAIRRRGIAGPERDGPLGRGGLGPGPRRRRPGGDRHGRLPFANLKSLWDVNLLPGVVKYGDLPGLLSLAAPTRLLAGRGGE